MVTSKFNHRIYISYFFVSVFIGGIISLLYFRVVDVYESGRSEIGIIVILLISLLLFYNTSKWANKITVDKQTISIKGLFKRRIINYSEVASINILALESLHWFIGMDTVATKLDLENGSKIVIADAFYKNVGEIKKAICENFEEKIEPFRQPKSRITSKGTVLEKDFGKFAGNPYTSFNGLVIFGWAVFILISLLVMKRPLVPMHLFILFPCVFVYWGFANQLNYFLVSNQRLIVRNHFLPWINKEYAVSEILAFDFESPYRRSQALRIIKQDFRSKLYCAGSLRDKHWSALREKLGELQIHRIENYY